MVAKYVDWIDQHVKSYSDAWAKCAEVTLAMAAAFPELQRVRGHYHCLAWGARAHWWLKTKEGVIVDPTVKQFPSCAAPGVYKAHVEGAPEPTGLCMNCGEYCYDHAHACCKVCTDIIVAEYGGGISDDRSRRDAVIAEVYESCKVPKEYFDPEYIPPALSRKGNTMIKDHEPVSEKNNSPFRYPTRRVKRSCGTFD